MITLIRNSTGGVLKLWDGNNSVATIANNAAAQHLQTLITRVSVGNANFTRLSGSFVNNDSYIATRNGNLVTFTGNQATVVFR